MRVSDYETVALMSIYDVASEVYVKCMEEMGIGDLAHTIPIYAPAYSRGKEKGRVAINPQTKQCEEVLVHNEEIFLDVRRRAPGEYLEDMSPDVQLDVMRITTQWICITVAHECMHVYQMTKGIGYDGLMEEKEAFAYANRPHEKEADQYAHAFVQANRSYIEHLSYTLMDQLNAQELVQG